MNLLIQNPGVAPIESYTLLGASGSRDNNDVNGKFGSGNKLGITCLLRKGHKVTVYAGTDRLVYGTREAEFEGKPCKRVTLSINGKKPVDLGWTLDWGCVDWTHTHMGLRELVVNALDASIKGRGYKADLQTGDLKVALDPTKPRAKGGFTRVYVEVNEDVEQFVEELPKRFLHFTDTPLDQVILPKAGRELSDGGRPMIYLCGVYVCELPGEAGIYDYNFQAGGIEIDECRNSNEYSVRGAIAKLLRRASAAELAPIFEAIGQGKVTMEAKLDPYYLCPSWDTPRDVEKANWQAAWKQAHGDAVVTPSDSRSLEYVQRKGLRAKSIDSSGWRESLQRFGIKADSDVLSAGEMVGRIPCGVDVATYNSFTTFWSRAKEGGMTDGKDSPVVAGFREDKHTTNVYVEGDTVFVKAGLDGLDTCKAILEGIAEYVTGAGTLTGRFQDWAFTFLLEVL